MEAFNTVKSPADLRAAGLSSTLGTVHLPEKPTPSEVDIKYEATDGAVPAGLALMLSSQLLSKAGTEIKERIVRLFHMPELLDRSHLTLCQGRVTNHQSCTTMTEGRMQAAASTVEIFLEGTKRDNRQFRL